MLGYILYILFVVWSYSAVWLVHLKDKGNNSALLKRLGGARCECVQYDLMRAISVNRLVSHFVGAF